MSKIQNRVKSAPVKDDTSVTPLQYGFFTKSFNYKCTFVSWPFPAIAFGWVQQQTHPKVMTNMLNCPEFTKSILTWTKNWRNCSTDFAWQQQDILAENLYYLTIGSSEKKDETDKNWPAHVQ